MTFVCKNLRQMKRKM